MPRNYMSPAQRGHGFHGRQGGTIRRHLPAIFYTPAGKALRAHKRRHGEIDAKRIVETMKKTGRIEFQDDRAEAAFEALVAIVHTKLSDGGETVDSSGNPKTVLPVFEGSEKGRIAAASKILEYAQVKPVIKTETVLKTAEDWLKSIDDDGAE